MTVTRQMALSFPHQPRYQPEEFMPMPCNASALAALERLATQGYGLLYVWGGLGSGKTHFGRLAHARLGGQWLTPETMPEDPTSTLCAVVDDADHLDAAGQDTLFHMYNHMVSQKGTLVVLSQSPASMLKQLPDLKTRLAAMPDAQLKPMAQNQLQTLLVKLADDRQLTLDPAVMRYVLRHTERSPKALESLVAHLDSRALETQRRITIPLVKSVLSCS